MKTRFDNDVAESTCAVYAENEIVLSWLIRANAICDENKVGQQHD